MIGRLVLVILITAGLAVGLFPQITRAQQKRSPRPLAPGVLTVIPNKVHAGETFTAPGPLRELIESVAGLDWTPNFTAKSNTLLEKSKIVILRHDVWSLEFAFKPLRMIYIDIPQPNGKMHRKLIWYMVYRVKNTGAHLGPSPQEDDFGNVTYVTAPAEPKIRFFPHAVLEGRIRNHKTGQYEQKSYLDRVIPVAIPVIQYREDPAIMLRDSVSMSRIEIPVSPEAIDKSVWGVFTWEAVDPRIDYFSVYMQGLTNAFRSEELPGGGRRYTHRTLKLNFWRPGDSADEHEREIRYGVQIVSDPIRQKEIFGHYGIDERLDYLWLYR